MWSRDGLKNGSSSAMMYRSTPHLFVYQPCEDDEEATVPDDLDAEDTEPSDSGYAASSSGSGSAATPEAIYYSTMELSSHRKEKDAMRRLSFIKYAATEVYSTGSTSGSSSSGGDHSSVTDDPHLVPVVSKGQQMLTELELLRVETFFRGHQTQIFVGKSLANLYLRQAKSLVGLNRCSSQPDVCVRTLQRQTDRLTDWQLKFTGIPVVLLDLGGTKSRRLRRIQLILAERGTGFTLWCDTIDNLSNYEAAGPTFHTMRTSTDHRQIAGLSFDSADAAQQLFRHIEKLTSDPANIRLSTPKRASRTSSLLRFWTGNKNNQVPKKKTAKTVLPRKCDISQPCFFQHVTSVDSTDRGKFFSLQALVPNQ